ncbi:MAG: Nramp family divalent metal transporter [Cyclobacteriaceae bacterium]|nr:Nramp family divalent metal transporter [Cyclobacteriaceae bacterium]
MNKLVNKLWLALLSIGPGLFCIGYTIGTGSVTSMIKSGSQYGMQLLWVLFLSAFFAWVLMEAYGRYAAVTGETAIHSFKNRLKFGRFWAILAVVGVVMGQWSSLSGIIGLTSHALYEVMRLFIPGLNENNYWAVLIIAMAILIFIYMLLLVGRYSFFEKLLVVFVTIMGVSFVVSMFIELPAPGTIVKGFIPTVPVGGELMVAAFVGTTMAAPTFVVRPLIVKEKGWNKETLKAQSRDALWAAVLMFLISACIMVVATGVLFGSGKVVNRVLDMVYVLEPLAGKFAVALFMFGAMSAGLSSAIPIIMVLPLLVGDYKQGVMDVRSKSFRILTGVACVVGLMVPVLGTNPIMAQVATQIASVFILPVVIGGIIVLINRTSLMGENKAGVGMNAGLAMAFIFSLVISYTGILGLINYLGG